MYICNDCGNECIPRVVDQGIGRYEFWGEKCSDRKLALTSACCDAEVLDESGWTISVDDYEQGLRDAEADDRNDERWLKEHE